jgi:hypothetical protein
VPLVAADDCGEAGRALLDEGGCFPVLIQYLKRLGLDTADGGAGDGRDGMGGTGWGGPAGSEYPVRTVDQGWRLLDLLGTDLVKDLSARAD